MRDNLIPGDSQTLSKGPSMFPVGFPRHLVRGEGVTVWDEAGHPYTDWICGLGTNGLGMGHPVVTAAVQAQLARGVSFSLPTHLEAALAEQLVDCLPSAEQVRFVKTGSEGCAGAVRIARLATGRKTIAVCGYHGWHDWYAASLPESPGVPWTLARLVRTFRYNDLDSLDDVLDESVAAVMLEPVLHTPPAPGFLAGVAALCRRNGSVLIFDESVTGFRVSESGAQGRYGVTPDLAVVGKAMANGFPLAAIVGSRSYMAHAWPISGTFGGETLSLAAAIATVQHYRGHPTLLPTMHDLGTRLILRLRDTLPGFTVDGLPWKPRISHEDSVRLAALVLGLATRGHLIHPRGFYISCAHTEDDVAALVGAAGEAARDPWETATPLSTLNSFAHKTWMT